MKNPPAIKFVRELLKDDHKENTYPIEYPNWQSPFLIQSRQEYERRPISVFNFWGRSNECRVQFHGDVWKNASVRGYSVCDNIYFLEKFMQEEKGEKWVSLWSPHYYRFDISELLKINGMSKLSISLPGAGKKCFRSTGESCCNSLMVHQSDKLAWSYPWDESNSVPVDAGNEIELINKALDWEYKYVYYRSCMQNAEMYRVEPYIKNYILPIINAA